MKNKNIHGILLAAFLLVSSTQACFFTTTPSPTAQPDTLPPTQPSSSPLATLPGETSRVLGDLGSVAVTLDSARQVTGTYDINSEAAVILTVADANGYGWMLSIPAGALLTTTEIKMTPFATIDFSQSQVRIISGIQLEPDGLQFVDSARLSVTAPSSDPGVGLIFSFQQDGSHVSFAPTTNTTGGKTAIAQIWHFSSEGYDNAKDAGQDGMDQYRKMAEEDYRLARDAAKQFIRNGPPAPPFPPSISMFCRGTEVNPEQNEAYEYMREFLDPYDEYVYVLLAAIRDMQLTNSKIDTTPGEEAATQILQMAEKTIKDLGVQYQKDKPPDRLIAAIYTGLQIERQIQLLSGETPLILFPDKIIYWASTVRDYYLNELKTKHDYRAFPTLLTLEKWVQLFGGPDRLADIMSAMTFEVTIDDSFDGTWLSSGKTYATGHVEQNADVKNVNNQHLLELWGELDNFRLKVTNGTYTNPTGTYPVTGQTYNGQLWLKNWDACVTKSFDVVLSGFSGVEDVKNRNTAGAASRAGLKQYWWDAGFFMFTVPMRNLNPTLGDQDFSGSGSAADGAFTGSGKIHIVIKHTP